MVEKTPVPTKTGIERFSYWDEVLNEMQRFWGEALPLGLPTWTRGTRPTTELTPWVPRMDVYEQGDALVVKAELPGIRKEDVEVTLEEGDLVIKGERKQEHEVKEDRYYRMERSYGRFYRRLPLPAEVKPEEVKATFTDGVLEVLVPEPVEQAPAPHTVAVT